MGKVVLGPSHTAGSERKYHRLGGCRHAPTDPSPINVVDETVAESLGRGCRLCFPDDGDDHARV